MTKPITARKCVDKVDKSLRILNQFLASIAIAIQSNPDISSLIVSDLRVIVDLAVNYMTYKKLTDMIDELFRYLATLREFDCGSELSDLVRKTVSDVYGDLLDFCRQVRLLLVDKKGQLRKYTVVAFLRVQWEPFETRFGKVSSSFRYHLGVLGHYVKALQYNAIQDGKAPPKLKDQVSSAPILTNYPISKTLITVATSSFLGTSLLDAGSLRLVEHLR